MSEKILVRGNFKKSNWLSTLLFILCACDIIGMLIYLFANGMDSLEWAAFLYVPMSFGAVILFAAGIGCLQLTRSLEISNAEIVGKTLFGKRVNLPVTQLSAVGTAAFGKITFATSSGIIAFAGLLNRDEIYACTSKLINEKENRTVASGNSDANELKRYKELLDSGAITQEEYDKKKNQLLGL